MRRIASCATVTNPLSGKMEDRVIIDSNGDRTILLQNHEVEPCIHVYYTKYKGVGARNCITESVDHSVEYQKDKYKLSLTGNK